MGNWKIENVLTKFYLNSLVYDRNIFALPRSKPSLWKSSEIFGKMSESWGNSEN